MEKETKRRGRPATGKVRSIVIGASVTEQERDLIKKYTKDNDITLARLLLKAIEKNIK